MSKNGLAYVLTFALALVGWMASSNAQRAGEVFRVGIVALVSASTTEQWLKAFRDDLRKFGYEEGKNLVLEERFANGQRDRLKDLVIELAGLKVDVFLAAGEPSLLAAKAHGENIPIVTVGCDPLERLLGSLARPGGNATGFTCISSDLGSKRLGLMKNLMPSAKRIAILYSAPDNLEAELQDTTAVGHHIALEVVRFPVRSPDDFEPAFKQMAEQKCDALYILASSFANFHRGRLAQLALEQRLPAMYGFREFAEAGGLIAYGAPLRDGFRRAAYQVSKILRVASPAEIPVEQPTHFELVLNLKTAKTLGFEIPASLLAQAHEIIE
jgi:putative tryptophan/tyrosine transport system substrate-binding protein